MVTRDEYFKTICASMIAYGEAFCDIISDIINIDNSRDSTKPFIDYIKACRMGDYGDLLTKVKCPSDVWDYLLYVEMETRRTRVAFELMADYAAYNTTFGESTYNELRQYFEDECGAEVDEIIEDCFDTFNECNP